MARTEAAQQPPAATPASEAAGSVARESTRLILGLSAGHAVKHFYQQGFLLLLPHIKDGLGLTDIAVGGIVGMRSAAMGAMNVPAGVFTDMFRRRIAWMLTASMLCLTLGYLVIGLANQYWLILLAVTIAGAGTSMWHAPAFAELGARYPERRAMAIAAHRSGGSIGDSTAPFVVGLLLGGVSFWGLNWGGFDWRTVALLHVVPAAFTGAVILLTFKTAGVGAPTSVTFRDYVGSVGPLFRNVTVLTMVSVTALRGMAHTSFAAFLVLYLKDDLEYSDLSVGFHLGLLTLLGILSGPVMGAISDRIGRRAVILSGLIATSALMYAFLWADEGPALTVTLALLGTVLFSVNSIMTAAAMDAVERGTEGSAVAMLFTGGAVVGAVSPVIAGWVNGNWGFSGVILYAATIVAVASVIAAVAPMASTPASGAPGDETATPLT
jgi:FSR family fosmidomycin resistance protein-like MFS transporter